MAVASRKLTKVSWYDSRAKMSVYRAEMDLTNMKCTHSAMACYTWSSPFHCLQPWIETTNHECVITRGHTWLSENTPCIYFWESMPYENICIILLLIAIRVQECSLGVKYHACLHNTIGRHTCDFSCLRFNSVTNVSNSMWCPRID